MALLFNSIRAGLGLLGAGTLKYKWDTRHSKYSSSTGDYHENDFEEEIGNAKEGMTEEDYASHWKSDVPKYFPHVLGTAKASKFDDGTEGFLLPPGKFPVMRNDHETGSVFITRPGHVLKGSADHHFEVKNGKIVYKQHGVGVSGEESRPLQYLNNIVARWMWARHAANMRRAWKKEGLLGKKS